jgi:CheY-like chemotaxis protein
MSFEIVDFELRPVVEDVLEMLAEKAEESRTELAAFVAGDLPEVVRSDPGRLRQVLTNLVGNAVKFTQDGEVVVEVSAAAGGGALDPEIRFEVRDTGIGIPEETLSSVFEQFYQADSSTTRRYGGTGLGLTISSRIVEAMGGRIGVESGVGVGSTFWFTVPLRAAPHGAPSRIPSPVLAGVRALIVDDNRTNRLVLERHLAAWKMTHDSVADGAQALELLRGAGGRRYDLALLDMQMPDLDGMGLARAIRECSRRRARRDRLDAFMRGRLE